MDHLQDLLYANNVFDGDVCAALWAAGVFRERLPVEAVIRILRTHDQHFNDANARAVAMAIVGHGSYPKEAPNNPMVATAPAAAEHQDPESEWTLVEKPSVVEQGGPSKGASLAELLSAPEKVRAVVEEARLCAAEVAGKHIVGFVGATGSGKTTQMRYLLGHNMCPKDYVVEGSGRIRVVDSDTQHAVLKIGHTKKSETLRPYAERAPEEVGRDTYFVDLAGDFDTSPELEVLIRNALVKAYILRKAASVRLVFMLPIGLLDAKRGGQIEGDIADVIELFPVDKWGAMRECLLTLVSPVARGSLEKLETRSTKEHLGAVHTEVSLLVDGATRNTRARRFFGDLRDDIKSSIAAVDEGRMPERPECFVANPLNAADRSAVRRFIAARRPVVAPDTDSFSVVLPVQAKTILTGTCAHLFGVAERALEAMLSGSASREAPSLAEGADSAGALIELLRVLVDDLDVDVRQFRDTRDGLLRALERAWDETWLALQRSFSQADLRPEETEACVARIRRMDEFLTRAASASRGKLPQFSPRSAADHTKSAMSELSSKVDRINVCEISPPALRRFATQLAQVEEAMKGSLRCGEGLQSERLACALWKHLEECSGALAIDETSCRPHELAVRLNRLRAIDAECGAWLVDQTGKRTDGLVSAAVQQLVNGLSELSSKCSEQLLRVVSGLSPQCVGQQGQQDLRDIKILSALRELTSSKELQDALQRDDLPAAYYDGVVKVDALTTELNYLDVSDVQLLPRRVALYETLACSGDVKLRLEMQQKQEQLFGDIRTKAQALQQEFTKEISAMHHRCINDAKTALRSSGGIAAREDSFSLDGLPHEAPSKLLLDAAILSTADAALRIPVASNALRKMIDALKATMSQVVAIIERKISEGLPMSQALPVAITFVNVLLEVVPGAAAEVSVGERGAAMLSEARLATNEISERVAKCCTAFVMSVPRCLMDTQRRVPARGWVSTYVEGMEAANALVLCDVAAAKPLRADLEASVAACVASIKARVKVAQDTSDFKGLASIIAEELYPMLQGGTALKSAALQLMKSCDNCVNALCDEAEATGANVDPNRFHTLMQQLKAMQAIFSDSEANNVGLQVHDTITKALNTMRRQALNAQQQFFELVRPSGAPDCVGIDSASVVNAVQLLPAMDEGPRGTCVRHLNNALKAALAKADTPRTKRALQGGDEVCFHLIFKNAEARKWIDADTMEKWSQYDRTISSQIEMSRDALLQAIARGDEGEVERSCQTLHRLGEQSEAAPDPETILSTHFRQLQQSYVDASKVNPEQAVQDLIAGYTALPTSALNLALPTEVVKTFQTYLLSKHSSISNSVQGGRFRLALEEYEAVQSVIRTVELSPTLQQLMGPSRVFMRTVENLRIDAQEMLAVSRATEGAEPVTEALRLLPEVSAAGRASLHAALEAAVKQVTSCEPSMLDDARAALVAVEVQRQLGQIANFNDTSAAPDTRATLHALKGMLNTFEQRHAGTCARARCNVIQVAMIALKVGRVSVALVDALGAARAVESHLAGDAAAEYAAAKTAFWVGLSKAIGGSLSAIKKGDLASVGFHYLTDVIEGYKSLRSTIELLQSIPSNLVQSTRFTCAANVEDDVRTAAAAFLSKPLASLLDTPRELVQYYVNVKLLTDELRKFLSAPLPQSGVNASTMAEVLRSLSVQCKDAWDKVVCSDFRMDRLKAFQQPASKLLAFSDSLEHVGVGDSVAQACGQYVHDAFLNLDKTLANTELLSTTPGTPVGSIARSLAAAREWARQAPCIEPRVSATVKSTLAKLAAVSPRLVRDIGTLMEHQGGAGRQIIHEHGDIFNNYTTEWAKRATTISLDACVDRIQCEPSIDKDVCASLKVLLRTHECNMTEYVKEMREAVLTGGVNKARNDIRRALKHAASQSKQQGTPESFCELVSRVCQMYALYSIQAAASDPASLNLGLPDPVLPHLIQVATVYRLLSLESSPKTLLQRFKNLLSSFSSTPKTHRIPNHLVQILTGEGKSITLAILAGVFTQYGIDVDIVCYSAYLTSRDKSKMEPFFTSMMGFKEGQVRYLTFAQLCALRTEGAGEIAKRVLTSNASVEGGRGRIAGTPRMLLIDEVDVFFSKRFYGATYNAGVNLQGDEEFKLVEAVYRHAGRPFDVLQSAELAAVKKKYDVIHQPLDVSSMHKLFDRIALKLSESSSCFSREGEYQLDKETGELQYKVGDQFEAVVYPNESSLLYLHLMHKGIITEAAAKKFVGLDVDFGHFSYAEVPSPSQNYYAGILGVTGTLRTVRTSTDAGTMILTKEDRSILRDDYAIERFTFAPSIFGDSKLNGGRGFEYALDTTIRYNDEDWCVAIVNAVKKALADGKGACIVFVKNAKKYLRILKQRPEFADVAVLSEATPEIRRPGIVSGAVSPGTVTIATRSFARGTDFYVPDDTHFTVIQTFFSSLESEHVQVRGRTARLASTGTYKMILCSVHMEGKFFMAEVKQAAKRPDGAPDDFDPSGAISTAVESVLRQAIAESKLAHELTKRRREKTDAKTAGRIQRKRIAKVLDDASWDVVDALLSTGDRKSKIDTLVSAAVAKIGAPVVFTVIIDVSTSMAGASWGSLVVAYNAFLAELGSLPPATKQNTTLSVIFFSSTASEYYTGPIASAKPLPTTCPGGRTNFEAALSMAHSVFTRPCYSGFDFKIVFFTDGYPNDGGNHLETVKQLADAFPTQVVEFCCIYFSAHGEIPHAVNELHDAFDTLKVSSQLLHPHDLPQLKSAMVTAAHSGPMYRQ